MRMGSGTDMALSLNPLYIVLTSSPLPVLGERMGLGVEARDSTRA
jgi:hypothetical protein